MFKFCVFLAIVLFASLTDAGTSASQIGTTILNSCGTNTTDPICRNISTGRQYIDRTIRYYVSTYFDDRAVLVTGAVTQTIFAKKISFYLSRDQQWGKPSILIDQNEFVMTFKWSFQ